jgi:hypothetical protein
MSDDIKDLLGLGEEDASQVNDGEDKPIEQQEETQDGESNALANLGNEGGEQQEGEDASSDKPLWEQYEYDSVDSFREDYEGLRKLKQEQEQWEMKEKEYQEMLEKEKNNHSLFIADESLARLSVLKNKEDKSEYEYFKDFVLNDNMSAAEIVGSNIADEFPDYSDEDIEDYLNSKYGLFFDQEEYDLLDDKEKAAYDRKRKAGQMELERDARNIKGKLMDEFNSIELPSNRQPSQVDITKQKTDARNAWTPYADNIVKEAGKFKFKLKVGDEDLEFDYSMNDKQISEYKSLLLDTVYEEAIGGNDEQKAKATYNWLKDTMFNQNKEAIMQSVVDKVSEKFSDYYDKELNNPSKRGTRDINQKLDSDGGDYGLSNFKKHLNI